MLPLTTEGPADRGAAWPFPVLPPETTSGNGEGGAVEVGETAA